MSSKFLFGVTIAVLIGVGYFWFSGQDQVSPVRAEKEKSAAPMPPVEVSVLTVQSHEVVFTKDLPGRTSAFQVAEIRPQVSGIILKRMFTEGSLVEKDQQLYQIDPATYQAAYDSAAASLAEAEADLKAVEPKVKRYTRLVKMGGVSRQQYDDVIASLAQARAGVAVAEANLAAARISLNYTKVLSPISGRIGRSSVTKGALVTANQTAALATVQNLDSIYVDVSQSSGDLIRLRRHMKEQNHDPKAVLFIGDETVPFEHKGEVLFSEVTVDQGTDMVQLRILFPNLDNELLPGLFVRARVEQFRQENAITVPQQSVVRNPDGSVSVWAVDAADTVQARPITVSKVIGDRWLVTSGLEPGDRVVVAGLQKIRPKAKVAPVEMKSTNS